MVELDVADAVNLLSIGFPWGPATSCPIKLDMKMLNARPSGRIMNPAVAGLCLAFFLGLASAPAQPRQVLHGHVPAVVRTLQPIGDLAASTNLSLAIGLPLRNREELTNLLRDIYDPTSTNYHRYLTPAQFTERFGPTEADYAAVRAFAEANGLTVTHTHPNRMLLDVSGPVSGIENAFQITMHVFKHPTENRNFFAPDREPSVPSDVPVLDISGLNNFKLPHPNFHIKPAGSTAGAKPMAGSGPDGNYMGYDFRAAYVPGVTLTGAGQTVGLLQFDGYLASDIALYENLNGLPNVPLQNILLDGFNGVPSGNGGEDEVSLDIEMSVSMAPGLSQILLYEAGPFGFPNDILNRMATDDAASQLSASWGWANGPSATTDQIFQQMDAQGQSFFHATGDSDALTTGEVDDPSQDFAPSDDPYITQVGGTTLTTTGTVVSWVSETVWNLRTPNPNAGDWGSSGGISSFYPIPSWQQGVSMANNMGSTTFRNFPDVALTADNIFVIADNGVEYPGTGGTSCASPLWAAFAALVNEQAVAAGQPPVGFLNPALYAIGEGANYNACFHDTTTGDTTWSGSPNAFFAVPGYDLCTGWGTPAGSNLINALAPPGTGPAFAVTTNIVTGGVGVGVVDPNECDSLDLVLENIGSAPATGIHATLTTTTPGAAITQTTSLYPDLPVNALAVNLTHFTISVSTNILCGTPINLVLVVKSDQVTRTISYALGTGCDEGTGRCPGIDMAVGMMGAPSTVVVGSNLTYTITVLNNGPDVARGVAVNQTLPANVTFRSASSSQGSVSYVGGGVSASLGSMNLNATATITVVVTPNAVGTVSSTATVASSEIDFNPANNSSTVDTQVIPPTADLAVGMAATPNPVSLGGILTYTVSVTNHGPSTAVNTLVTTALPANVTFVSADISQGSAVTSANNVICSLGDLGPGATAVATIEVRAIAVGGITASSTVSSSVLDPVPGNNTASVSTAVVPASDVALTMSGNPASAILGSNVTYVITALNLGPSPAANVTISDSLPAGSTFISASAHSTHTANSVTWTLTNNLTVGGSVMVTDIVSTSSFTTNQVPLTMTNSATVSSSSADPDPANGSAVVTTRVDIARPAIIAAGATLVGGSFVPANNGFVNPGETVTNILILQNIGNLATANLVATLLATNGVTPLGSSSQSYGALAAGGGLGSNIFAFTAATNGTGVIATLQLQNGTSNLGTVQFPFSFPTVSVFSNTTNIVIPDHGPGTPYPSSINVTGLTGVAGKVTVTLTNVNHTYPDDVDILLVGPAGQTTLLESHAGGSGVLTNTSLTFDDAAASYLPPSSQIVSGSYKPSQYGTVNFTNNFGGTVSINTTNPPPSPPYGTNLAAFNGSNPNGLWSLYVFDSSPGDDGIILGGWSMAISAGEPVSVGGDVAITGTAAPDPVQTGSSLTYTFNITNNGPNIANSVTFTDILPANGAFVSSNSTQ